MTLSGETTSEADPLNETASEADLPTAHFCNFEKEGIDGHAASLVATCGGPNGAFRVVHATLEIVNIADVVECDESSGRTLWVVGQYQLVVRHDVVCLWLELQNGLAKSTRR